MPFESLRGGGRPQIEGVHAREVLDSRGNPTVAVSVATSFGAVEEAMVPSGASTGANEAVELRDGDAKRYNGKGVQKAVSAVNDIIGPAIEGHRRNGAARDRPDVCSISTGRPNKGNLGANALLGVSLAVARAAAASLGIAAVPLSRRTVRGTLPVPMMNVINGGKHAVGALQFQECMIVPLGAPTFPRSRALRRGSLSRAGRVAARTRAADAGRRRGRLRAAAETTARSDGPHRFGDRARRIQTGRRRRDRARSGVERVLSRTATTTRSTRRAGSASDEMVALYRDLCARYPIVSIEDGLAEDDWNGWAKLTAAHRRSRATRGRRYLRDERRRSSRAAFAKASGNAILIKVNQIGTLTETLDAIDMAHKAGYATVISHRSGETEDTTIADIAVATGAGQIKTGSLSRSDRSRNTIA